MNIEDIRCILVIGAGSMGRQIAFMCALHGLEVILYDIEEDTGALSKASTFADELVNTGACTSKEKEDALSRIRTTTDPMEAVTADIVSESIPEDPVLKGQVFAKFNEICPEHTIFTTNTSSLLPSMFAEASGRPDRLIALHFHPPIWLCNVADIMPHAATSPGTTKLVTEFARKIGQVPIKMNREKSGYVFNTIFMAVLHHALALRSSDTASIEDIDRSWMGIMKTPVGPFGMMDNIGLDTVWRLTEFWAKTLDDPKRQKNADFLKDYVDKEWLGTKKGRGFYSYPHPEYAENDFFERDKD